MTAASATFTELAVLSKHLSAGIESLNSTEFHLENRTFFFKCIYSINAVEKKLLYPSSMRGQFFKVFQSLRKKKIFFRSTVKQD